MKSVPWSEADAVSASFLAIVPPAPVVAKLRRVQASVGIDTDVPPHVTVKAQPGLQDPRSWRGPMRELLGSIEPFTISLGPPGWFGDEILYLSIGGTGVIDLHLRILERLAHLGVEEYFEYEGDRYVPHLTVGAPWAPAGGGVGSLDELSARISQLCAGPIFVTEVVEFRRAEPGAPYREAAVMPLGGERAASGT